MKWRVKRMQELQSMLACTGMQSEQPEPDAADVCSSRRSETGHGVTHVTCGAGLRSHRQRLGKSEADVGWEQDGEALEQSRKQSTEWRKMSVCVVRPSALISLLLLTLWSEYWPRAVGVWPICYDHYVPDTYGEAETPGCPMRTKAGEFVQDTKVSFSPCYRTTPWDVTSPPPDCRDRGCVSGLVSERACCCGASQGVDRQDPKLAEGGACGEQVWGPYLTTGASAGQCPACKTGQGADNGIGGRVAETYGDPALKGQPDPQVFGHVTSLDYKLSSCSTKVRATFREMEELVDTACDVKSFFQLERCGNCAQAICRFHNELHWVSNSVYMCLQDLFLRRMECYAKWYHKWCTCKEFSHVPYKGKQGDWESNCVEPYYFSFVPFRGSFDGIPTIGTYPACSLSSRTATSLIATFLLALILVTFHVT